jgi:hypothetical protein
MSTTLAMQTLIQDLKTVRHRANTPISQFGTIDDLIKEAAENHFDDFKGIYDFPQLALIARLEEIGLSELAQLVKNGKYDGTPDAADKVGMLDFFDAKVNGFN